MSIVIDLILVGIILFFVIISAKRGFVRTAIELVGFFLALYLSITFSGIVAEGVYDTFVKEPLVKQVDEKVGGLETSIVNYNKAFDSLPDFVKDKAENYGLSSSGLAEELINNQDGKGFSETIVDYAAKPIVTNVIKVALYIILFIVLSFVFKFLARILNKLFSIPIIGGLNRTLGGIFGLAKGTIIAAAICIAISIIVSLTENGVLIFTNENINSTYLFKFLAGFNPLK